MTAQWSSKKVRELTAIAEPYATWFPDAFSFLGIRLAKYCMQQLLLSQSALETLLERHEDLLKKVSVKAKEELLSRFDYEKDQLSEMLWDVGRDATLAGIFGFLWGPSRHVWAYALSEKLFNIAD
jgi:hypothetical protein